MIFFYDLGIQIYVLVIRFASLFSPKARLWREGRQQLWQDLELKRKQLSTDQPLLWIHCASLGEFEQGRPIIEGLKKEAPTLQIALTFFSPSGYEVRKNYAHADLICYLPIDTPRNARKLIQILQPNLAIFVKYEFWYHHLKQLKEQEIPCLLISGLFRKNQIFFRWYGGLFRKMLPFFEQIFVQNESSEMLLKKLGLKQVVLSGDTRIDRVVEIAGQKRQFPLVAAFAAGHKVLVAGSTWPPDEALLVSFLGAEFPESWKLIIAPHELGKAHLQKIIKEFPATVLLYSQASKISAQEAKVLVIDNIGMLSALYFYGDIAYIGGGFGAGIHNTLEPIAFALPVLFGPRFQKFKEAVFLVQHGGAQVISDPKSFNLAFQKWQDPVSFQQASEIAESYIYQNKGSSMKIISYTLRCLKID